MDNVSTWNHLLYFHKTALDEYMDFGSHFFVCLFENNWKYIIQFIKEFTNTFYCLKEHIIVFINMLNIHTFKASLKK